MGAMPERSPEERMAALAKAAESRARRSELLRGVSCGEVRLEDVLASDDPVVRKTCVASTLGGEARRQGRQRHRGACECCK